MATQKTKLGRWANGYVERRNELLAARRAVTAHDTSRGITRDEVVSLHDAVTKRYRKD